MNLGKMVPWKENPRIKNPRKNGPREKNSRKKYPQKNSPRKNGPRKNGILEILFNLKIKPLFLRVNIDKFY